MDKAARMIRATAVAVAVLCGATAAASMLLGCAPKVEQCFEAVSINPKLALGIVFDRCKGEYKVTPVLGMQHVPPAEPQSDNGGPGAPFAY